MVQVGVAPGGPSPLTAPPRSLQVARAGRFGTKGLAITFVSDEGDAKILNEVQDRFEVNVAELPEEIDISTYSTYRPGGSPWPFALPPGSSCGAWAQILSFWGTSQLGSPMPSGRPGAMVRPVD